MNAFPSGLAARLRGIAADLDRLHRPTEERFLAFAAVLARSKTGLERIGASLASVAERMSGGEAAGVIVRLDEAVAQVVALTRSDDGHGASLGILGAKAGEVTSHLARLRKAIDEVRVLAMNAKIQAALLPPGHGEMAVFTVEIARLGNLALDSVDQTEVRLARLRRLLAEASREVATFDAVKAAELNVVQARLQDGLGTISARRAKAAEAAHCIGERSTEVGRHIAACIGEIQINDIASQRISHVSEAIGLLDQVLDPARMRDWLAEIAPERRAALAGAVLRLQAVQLRRTRDEFESRVADLVSHMGKLAESARGVRNLATSALGAHTGGASFVGELGREVVATRDLLKKMASARRTVRGLTSTTSADFAGMAADLDAIRSIDADMRVMGLNATLRCGRLGRTGLALGVVAQELRNCSKRTEEQARELSASLAGAMELAHSLVDDTQDDAERLSVAAVAAMESSLAALDELGSALDDALRDLHAEVAEVAASLDGAAASFDFGRSVGETLGEAATALEALADEIDPGRSDPRVVRAEVERLLRDHYTMDSERMVHGLFADDPAPHAPPPSARPETDDLDDVFF
jgi:hypothetical protein